MVPKRTVGEEKWHNTRSAQSGFYRLDSKMIPKSTQPASGKVWRGIHGIDNAGQRRKIVFKILPQ